MTDPKFNPQDAETLITLPAETLKNMVMLLERIEHKISVMSEIIKIGLEKEKESKRLNQNNK